MKLLLLSLFIAGTLYPHKGLALNNLRFAVNVPGSAPYLYYDNGSKGYLGLIVDVLAQVTEETGLKVIYVDSSRARIESLIQQAKIDAFFSSQSWLKDAEQLIVSQTIIQHKTYFYQITPFINSTTNQPTARPNPLIDNPIKNKSVNVDNLIICTRQNYIYPSIKRAINNGKLKRLDSTNQLSMMHMLIQQRCDITIMNNHNANAILALPAFKNAKIYRSPKAIDITPISIFLRPQLISVKNDINSTIVKMKAKGEIAQSIRRHEIYRTNP